MKGDRRMALDVETLEESFDLVAPQGDELMRTFYDRLFEIAPAVKPLFENVDMDRQRQALLNMLVVLRESLRDLDDIAPDLQDLGARHAGYGVRPEQYPFVGEALIGAMSEIAGDDWKPEYTAAWEEAYGVVKDVMLSGAPAQVQ
jgi:methyl-accepting chemotaxis protein